MARKNLSQCSSDNVVVVVEEADNSNNEVEEVISQSTLIWRAIKLPIYSVALVPLTVGSAAAYLQAGLFSLRRYFVLLSSSVLIITWLNLSNDVHDFDTGADKNKKESVVNIVGSRTGTLMAAYTLLALGFMGLTWAYVEAGDVRSIYLLTCSIMLGYIYQCPPFRLSYRGLGEPLCFAAFGPFATTAFYLMHSSQSVIQRLPINGTILSASLLVGLTTTLILFCSHFHQVDEDEAVMKMSPLVSCALTLPIAKLVVSYVEENYSDKSKIFMAKYFCVRLHAMFGAALSVGLVMAKSYIQRPILP
ncbi:2-carboxy-1,4-naphthoquinone phytyltransferase, chloroplastic-like isoform X1 [Papaver somniferum]|uniref:2-carboxy-1,4-naphthoquinone phytyltransferase, chloroplastic-like isoform X1 n=1 Tax=Papaver somniferum TaxID=3469 RepID=UPI000E6F842B|nr:2-carboxy-1,4-naphthoquinone phytyltransferase, chloroplastic-like isoform X1 [Papaver somniferum]